MPDIITNHPPGLRVSCHDQASHALAFMRDLDISGHTFLYSAFVSPNGHINAFSISSETYPPDALQSFADNLARDLHAQGFTDIPPKAGEPFVDFLERAFGSPVPLRRRSLH
jgi:hypothetical protein